MCVCVDFYVFVWYDDKQKGMRTVFTGQRYEKILEILSRDGFLSAADLEKIFSVSSETVRRDLSALERAGKLIRIHGGAMSPEKALHQKPLSKRLEENVAQKTELSITAASFIREGDILAIDAGSTAIEFCQVLRDRFQNLTIVVNSLRPFEILSKAPGFKVLLCGGNYNREEDTFYGILTCDAVRHLHIHKTFLFASGISLKDGATCFGEEARAVSKAFLSVSDKTFLLADSSKFECGAVYQLCSLFDNVTLITDSSLSTALFKKYQNAGVDIIRGGRQHA